ncbi:MAG: translation elongation factor Ts [Nitrospinae bacterium RIFCSPLOWO2_12_FULL_45_22]|nr:MAG: translation elongation factor Ts [Nitrospinae bacterium RIFCSPLOWO2_12_FULL_45_22]
MNVTASMVKELRDKTGAGMMDCKNALAEAGGDLEKAIGNLRAKGLAEALRKGSRPTSEGLIGSYIHAGGKLGVLVEVNCETDFVAKTPEFIELVKDLSMQIAATNPLYLKQEDISGEVLDKERQVFAAEAQAAGKPEKVIEKIVEGKMEKYFSEVCLLEQPFIKDPDLRIEQVISQKIGLLGENITIKRFARFQVGDEGKS